MPTADPELSALSRVAREASLVPPPRPDWPAVEVALRAQIAARPAPHRVFGRPSGLASAFGFAAAAAVLLALGGLAPETAVSLAPAATLFTNEARLTASSLQPGDVVEAAHGPLTLGIEGGQVVLAAGSRAVLRRTTKGAVRLELERGLLEAEVPPPVNAGLDEALVIDCGATRVAVHGTHFFVERTPSEVRVRVTRGTVAVGAAGRPGPTLGWLLVAPSEGAFSLNGARAARWLSPGQWSPVVAPLLEPLPGAWADSALPSEEPVVPAAPSPAPADSPAAASPAPAPVPASDGPAWITEAEIGSRVRACLQSALPGLPPGVVFSTSARPVVDGTRRITAIQFDPPLHPSAVSCGFVAGRLRGQGAPLPISIEYRARGAVEP